MIVKPLEPPDTQGLTRQQGLKNIEKRMEANKAWMTEEGIELGPGYDLRTGKPIKTLKELRLEEEKLQRAKRFKQKAEAARRK